MATRANPFYQFRTPGMEQGMAGLASIFAGGSDVKPSQIVENEAQARAANALASERSAKMQGQLDTNAAMTSDPRMLAEIFMNGGRTYDDPLQQNANYQAPAPTNYDLTARPKAGDVSSMFMPTVTGTDRVAGAMREILARGGKVDELGKVMGQAGFLQNVQAGTADAGMPYMPLFGSAPTVNTALTTGAQDRMSARDASEKLTEATKVENIRAGSRTNVANIQQAGANTRNAATNVTREIIATGKLNAPGKGGKALVVPKVSVADAKAMTGAIEAGLKEQGINVDPSVLTGLVAAAASRMQDPNRQESYKNLAGAVDSLMVDLENNELDGFKRKVTPRMLRSDKTTLDRQPAASKKTPAIDKVVGAPKGSAIGNFDAGKGWQVRDPEGKLIGYVQE